MISRLSKKIQFLFVYIQEEQCPKHKNECKIQIGTNEIPLIKVEAITNWQLYIELNKMLVSCATSRSTEGQLSIYATIMQIN